MDGAQIRAAEELNVTVRSRNQTAASREELYCYLKNTQIYKDEVVNKGCLPRHKKLDEKTVTRPILAQVNRKARTMA
jgi:hypothetical protein